MKRISKEIKYFNEEDEAGSVAYINKISELKLIIVRTIENDI